MYSLKILFCSVLLYFCKAEPFSLVTDKPALTYLDSTVFPFGNISASRLERGSKHYYTNFHAQLAVPLDDNFTIEFVFYENVNNQFRRSFIELQYKWCSFLFKDHIFGSALRRQISYDCCPIPPGEYHFLNMTAATDHLPRLPFFKGRIYMNLKMKTKNILKGYCDMELKRVKPNKQ